MMNTKKFLISLGVTISVMPLLAADCLGVQTECEVDEDCLEGETCNTITGLCEGAEGEGEGEGDVACGPAGDLDDGACIEDRDTAVLADPLVCDGDTCVDPDSLLAQCPGGQAADAYDGGPLIIDASIITENTNGDTCANNVNSYASLVYSEDAFDTSLNAQRLKFINAAGTESGTYSDTTLLPDIDDSVGGGYFIVSYFLCGDGADGAVQLTNNGGTKGNAFCMDEATGP